MLRPIRHFYKDTFCATRAHADFTYLDKGTQRLLSVWVPLGDVRMDGGSIVYLRGSHKLNHEDLRARLNGIGQRSGDERPISDDLEAVATLAGEPWMYTNFSAGDVVMHSPFIIHATLDCNTDAMRLSTDLRFAVADDEIDYRWKGAWRGDDGF
ncbi:MAG: hypothetical protein EBZ77_00330 [Chitinophagia bacterium]|nr:hypothetical protein [Chitinophagia bacterium]